MKRLLALFFVLCLRSIAEATCSSTPYTVGPYNICGASYGSSAASHITVTYSPTAGNGVFLMATFRPEVPIVSIRDQASNDLTCFVASPNTPTNLVASDTDDERWVSYYCPSIPSGVTSITLNMASTLAFGNFVLFEIDPTNIASTGFWDNDVFNVTLGAKAQVWTSSVTNSHANDLMVAFMHNGNVTFPPGGYPPVTGGAGYTTITSTPQYTANQNLQMLSVSASGVQTSTITWGVDNYNGFGFLVGLKSNDTTTDQEGFAFGDDDGNEAAHTLDSQDTNLTAPLGTQTLRMLLNVTGGGYSATPALRYQKNGSGGYVDVPVGSTTPGETGTIAVADVTNSGNNTASTSWAVSNPDASTGDLLIFNLSWDDSTTTVDATPDNGPNGEVPVVIQGPLINNATSDRAKAWYYVATGAWTAGTVTVTPTASEQWTASVIRVPTGEFDSSSPITTSSASASAAVGTPTTPAYTASSSDGGGRIVVYITGDTDNPDGNSVSYTPLTSVDRGAIADEVDVRTDVASDNESIAAASGWTFPADRAWICISYIVRPPPDTTNEIYVSASANVTAGGEATTARLAAPSGKTTGDFDTGRRWDDENGTDAVTLTDDNYSEFEWVLTTQSPGATDDYYEFRTYIGGMATDSYSVTPKWTIGTEVAGGDEGIHLILTGPFL